MDYSRYYASSYDYDAEQDYEDLLYQHEWIQREEADFEDFLERRDEQAKKDEQDYEDLLYQHEWIQREEADFEDFLERRDEQAKKDEQDFEDYLQRWNEQAKKDEQDFERYMERSAIRAWELEQTDRLGEKEVVKNPSRTDTSAAAAAVAAPQTPLADPVRLTAKCTICHHAPANTPCSHTVPFADCCDTSSVKREARCPVCKTAVVDRVLRT
ncbi:hypothetical protein Q9L58_002282 [Maublancomyces gigas]|uniref:RING-type domain-containing protein n=1 Tax=Discina gigas TaxID=1032678 RepID=A0ABR3GS01_9PEZI